MGDDCPGCHGPAGLMVAASPARCSRRVVPPIREPLTIERSAGGRVLSG
jgi:hypothetical protein